MRHPVVVIVWSCLAATVGCEGVPSTSPSADAMFAPREAKLHPVFTKLASWEGDARPEGVEALVELRDAFGDPCKGAGTFTFELFDFRRDQPDPRGRRVSQPWVSRVVSADEQRERWSKTGRCYAFKLKADGVRSDASHVLTVTFAPVDGPRAFDRVVLGGSSQ